MARLDPDKLPHHLAIIPDGNGRWAQARGLPREAGHRQGCEALRDVVRAAHELGIRLLTLYAFSTENWDRPKHEVREIMNLLEEYLETLSGLLPDLAQVRNSGERTLRTEIRPLPSHS